MLARAGLAFERLAPALWPAIGLAGLYLSAALLGLFAHIPWAMQSLLLAAAVTAVALALWRGLAVFAWPDAFAGARRLEYDSALAHRPISEREDVPAGSGDAFTAALWQAHRDRMAKLGALRLALPHADLKRVDPRGLRWALLALLAAALFVARDDLGARLASGFVSASDAGIDAWIDPPAYTGLALTPVPAGGVVSVPVGSVLTLRVHGAPRAPHVVSGANPPGAVTGGDGSYAATATIRHDGRLRVRVAGHELADWRISVIPDNKPQIAFTGTPQRTEHGALSIRYRGSDDYGVTQIAMIVAPKDRPGAPSVRVPLDGGGGKTFEATSFADLTGNPYAGMMVEARMEARDGAGQSTLSAPVSFILPARLFTDPLARALVEQRQLLAAAPDAQARRKVAEMLSAFTIAPEKFFEDKRGAYMAIRAAHWGIRGAKTQGDLDHVSQLLWDTALALERGGLLSAQEELRRLQALLNQAMMNGAPQEEIDQLLARYNQAMQRYMEALAANPDAPGEQPQNENAVTLGENDIQKMMELIQELSQAGQREQAAQMLAMLQSMLENMRMVQSGQGQGQGQQGNKALNDAMNKLGETMGQQRGLLDRTFRQSQGQGDPKDGGAQGLARQQQQLQQQMGEARKNVDPKLTAPLDDAARAMQQSADALQKGDLESARAAQQQALQAMSQAQQQMAEQARRESGQSSQNRSDPLGRSTEGQNSVNIPDASALARARAILEELRRRAGEMGRPQEERDYIDRLLKSF